VVSINFVEEGEGDRGVSEEKVERKGEGVMVDLVMWASMGALARSVHVKGRCAVMALGLCVAVWESMGGKRVEGMVR
jgi:hypothetical protein